MRTHNKNNRAVDELPSQPSQLADSTRCRSPPTVDPRVPKYCITCGRLISPSHRNFAERRHCSKTCKATRLTGKDREMEECFRGLARARGAGGGVVECGEVERMILPKGSGNGEVDDEAASGESEDVASGEESEEGARGKIEGKTEADKQKAGMQAAQFRERVRRAARRVVVLNDSGTEESRFEAIQSGKIVEPSFAKGEWGVRLRR